MAVCVVRRKAHDSTPFCCAPTAYGRFASVVAALGVLVELDITVEKRPANPIPTSAITVQGQPGTFGGTLAVALPEDVATFNPYGLTSSSTLEVLRQLYAPLVGFNPTTGKTLPEEGLAKSFEADGKVVTIRLREGLLFSDGVPIRADDVVYSFMVALDPDLHAPIADMLAVNGREPDVSKVDDSTVKLVFSESYPAIGYVLSQMPVISAGADAQSKIDRGHFEEALGPDTPPTSIACSGPFCIGSYERGRRITLNYNPNYWKSTRRACDFRISITLSTSSVWRTTRSNSDSRTAGSASPSISTPRPWWSLARARITTSPRTSASGSERGNCSGT